jgi:hypothetical protein
MAVEKNSERGPDIKDQNHVGLVREIEIRWQSGQNGTAHPRERGIAWDLCGRAAPLKAAH